MADDIGPGTRVECVDADGQTRLVKGTVYTIRSINNSFFYLQEFRGPKMGWYPSRFRPIRDTRRAATIEKLRGLTDDPDRVIGPDKSDRVRVPEVVV